jgi:hypothetical protein
MPDRPQKIKFADMRDVGVRGLLIYCSDYKRSHLIAPSGDHWPDDMRLTDMPRAGVIKHEAVHRCGGFEVRFPDGRPSRYFYLDDVPGRRLDPNLVDSEWALEEAKALARAERDQLRDAKR